LRSAILGPVAVKAAPRLADEWAERRRWRFRQTPDRRVHTIDEALAFVDEVGLCVFQGEKGGLPSFYGAIAGRDGPAPKWGQHDRAYGQAWDWKDKLFSQGRVYYGKALGDFRLLASRAILPYLIAACAPGPVGDADDYLELYQDGKLGADAKSIYEALLRTGPASTTKLRQAAQMLGKGGQFRRFEQALAELQRALLAAPTGIARDNRWKYTFRYAPLHVAFPKEVAAATELSSRAATAHLLRHYLDLGGPTPLSAPTRLFGWPSERAGRAAEKLAEDGLARLEGAGGGRWILPVPGPVGPGSPTSP
jgi:hypothetical protein